MSCARATAATTATAAHRCVRRPSRTRRAVARRSAKAPRDEDDVVEDEVVADTTMVRDASSTTASSLAPDSDATRANGAMMASPSSPAPPHAHREASRLGWRTTFVSCVAVASACAVAALEIDRRKRIEARERGIDPDADTHAALTELVRVAEELFQRAPSEKNATKVNEARAALRDVERRQRERDEAVRRAEEWKSRVRVKESENDDDRSFAAIGGDAREEGLRVEAILSAKRREREAEAKKPPLAGSSMEWMKADDYLNRVLEKESTDHVEEEDIASTPKVVDGETFEEYPEELVEAMRRMEADIATGTYNEEALYEKYKDVLDAFGEEFEPTTEVDDDGDENEHPQLLDPWWWRKARALFLIIVTPSPNAPEEFFAMQMVPDNIPERARPEDKYHLVAFEDRRDAENFCFLMQSQRPRGEMDVELKGIVSMKPVGPKELQQLADSVDYGVTVVGGGRVDLSPNRLYVDVLNHIAHIGGEAYLWTFARDVKRDFDNAQEDDNGATAPR